MHVMNSLKAGQVRLCMRVGGCVCSPALSEAVIAADPNFGASTESKDSQDNNETLMVPRYYLFT